MPTRTQPQKLTKTKTATPIKASEIATQKGSAMATTTRPHLDKAADYIARGDGFYIKAAEEIQAEQRADPTLSNREIGEHLGRSHTWINKLVQIDTSGTGGSNSIDPHKPFVDLNRGRQATKQTLRSATEEDLRELIQELPEEQVERINQATTRARSDNSGPSDESEDRRGQWTERKPKDIIGKRLEEGEQKRKEERLEIERSPEGKAARHAQGLLRKAVSTSSSSPEESVSLLQKTAQILTDNPHLTVQVSVEDSE